MTIEKTEKLLRSLFTASGLEWQGAWSAGDNEIALGNDEVVLSYDTDTLWELGQPWGVAPLNYNPGGFDRRSGDGEPPSLESGGWTSYGSAQEACRAAVLLLVTLRMDAWLAGMAEEGAER